MSNQPTSVAAPPVPQKTFLGHPVGLYVLFFTELWERLSFYSMRGVLTLYTATVVLATMQSPGAHADLIYGAYLGFVYSAPLIGGMLADRLLGQRQAIYIGGTLMAIAHFTLAGHALMWAKGTPIQELNWMFFLALGLLSAGNGLFKPNISTIVGTLYQAGDARRDAAFTIFYMGINIGAFLSSFSGQIAQSYGWYYAFLIAGTGMILGQIIFAFGTPALAGRGLPPPGASLAKPGWLGMPSGLLLALGVIVFVPLAGYLISHPEWMQSLAAVVAVPVLLYLLWEAKRGSSEEGGRMIVALVLCGFSMVFWGFFELAGSTITRFTDEAVNRNFFGTELKAAFLSNVVNPLLIIVLSVPFAGLWVWLDKRRMEPASPVKFGLGLLQLSLGFVMLYFGAHEAQTAGKCAMYWLILAFLFHTTGELCLSPVGLSTITKLAPARLVGMFMGVWFMSSAIGNILAPRVAGVGPEAGFGDVFQRIAMITAGSGVLLLILSHPLRKLMHGVK